MCLKKTVTALTSGVVMAGSRILIVLNAKKKRRRLDWRTESKQNREENLKRNRTNDREGERIKLKKNKVKNKGRTM